MEFRPLCKSSTMLLLRALLAKTPVSSATTTEFGHERKKMYWEQLELRCRSLYTTQQANLAAATAASARGAICRCCEQCHAHRQLPIQTSVFPWDESGEPRFWTGQPPGNFYSPNPGADADGAPCRHGALTHTRSRMSGWSWPRMPWQRSSPDPNARFRQMPSSPDSQYGFSNSTGLAGTTGASSGVGAVDNIMSEESAVAAVNAAAMAAAQHSTQHPYNIVAANALPYGVWGPPPPYSDPNSPARRNYYHYIHPTNVQTTANNNNNNNNNNNSNNNNNHNNNSNNNISTNSGSMLPVDRAVTLSSCEQLLSNMNYRSSGIPYNEQNTMVGNVENACCTQLPHMHEAAKRQLGLVAGNNLKLKADYDNAPSDSDGGLRDRFSNTLPTRKPKKRLDAGIKSIGANTQSTHRINVQQVFAINNATNDTLLQTESQQQQKQQQQQLPQQQTREESIQSRVLCKTPATFAQQAVRYQRQGMENNAYITGNGECVVGLASGTYETCEPSESEVYFADVSSCCNMSVKNDNYYEDANLQQQLQQQQQQQQQQHHHRHHHQHHQHHHQHSNCSHSSSSNNEDYLTQRFRQRENSVRSRLPPNQTPHIAVEFIDNLNLNLSALTPKMAASVNTLQKEISRQSMCSVDSEAKTEFTDLSPATPSAAQKHFGSNSKIVQHAATSTAELNDQQQLQQQQQSQLSSVTPPPPAEFVTSSYPYAAETQTFEAHRRSTKNLQEVRLVSDDAHYEIINDVPCQFTSLRLSRRSSAQPQSAVLQRQSQSQTPLNNKTNNKHHDLSALSLHKMKSTKTRSRDHLDVSPFNYGTDHNKKDITKERSTSADERKRL